MVGASGRERWPERAGALVRPGVGFSVGPWKGQHHGSTDAPHHRGPGGRCGWRAAVCYIQPRSLQHIAAGASTCAPPRLLRLGLASRPADRPRARASGGGQHLDHQHGHHVRGHLAERRGSHTGAPEGPGHGAVPEHLGQQARHRHGGQHRLSTSPPGPVHVLRPNQERYLPVGHRRWPGFWQYTVRRQPPARAQHRHEGWEVPDAALVCLSFRPVPFYRRVLAEELRDDACHRRRAHWPHESTAPLHADFGLGHPRHRGRPPSSSGFE